MAKRNLSTFLNELAQKAGIASDSKELIDFLAHGELTRIEVPETLDTSFSTSLLSVKDAKNNHPEIKKHYFGEIMSNVDRSLKSVYDANPEIFTADVITELNGESSSTKRIALVVDKLKAAKAAEGSGKDGKMTDEEKKKLTTTIDDLNNQLRVEKEARTREKKDADTNLANYKIRHMRGSLLSGLKTTFDELSGPARESALQALIDNELRENGVQFVIGDNDQLTIQKTDGSNYFDSSNKLVTVQSFIESTMSKNKVLKQSQGGGGQNNNNNQDQNRDNKGGGGQNNNSRVPRETGGGEQNKDNHNRGVRSLTASARESIGAKGSGGN